jgi:hypothetical protein
MQSLSLSLSLQSICSIGLRGPLLETDECQAGPPPTVNITQQTIGEWVAQRQVMASDFIVSLDYMRYLRDRIVVRSRHVLIHISNT